MDHQVNLQESRRRRIPIGEGPHRYIAAWRLIPPASEPAACRCPECRGVARGSYAQLAIYRTGLLRTGASPMTPSSSSQTMLSNGQPAPASSRYLSERHPRREITPFTACQAS